MPQLMYLVEKLGARDTKDVMPALCTRRNTVHSCDLSCSKDDEKTMFVFKYIKENY